MKYIDHLKELRKRILLSFFVLIVSFCIFLYYASFVGEILSKPLFDLFDDSDKKRMIFTALPEVFVSNLKIALFAAFLTSFPFFNITNSIIYLSSFIQKRKKNLYSYFFFNTNSFYLRCRFCLFFFDPYNLGFFSIF